MIKELSVLGGLGLFYGLVLAYFAKKFGKKPEDPKIKQVRDILPGVNCGACGLAGCDAFAKAVVEGKVPIDACIVGKKPVAEKIAKILGKKIEATETQPTKKS